MVCGVGSAEIEPGLDRSRWTPVACRESHRGFHEWGCPNQVLRAVSGVRPELRDRRPPCSLSPTAPPTEGDRPVTAGASAAGLDIPDPDAIIPIHAGRAFGLRRDGLAASPARCPRPALLP